MEVLKLRMRLSVAFLRFFRTQRFLCKRKKDAMSMSTVLILTLVESVLTLWAHSKTFHSKLQAAVQCSFLKHADPLTIVTFETTVEFGSPSGSPFDCGLTAISGI